MRLKPRHYVLIAVLLALGIWNAVRRGHERSRGLVPSNINSPGWQAYDQAASLRDSPDAQFTPALDTLRTQADAASGPGGADLRNCLMWLQYYRHSAPTAGGSKGNWGMLASSHVQTCTAEHRDVGR